MKNKYIAFIYYAIQWVIWIVALITWTTTDLPISNMPVKIAILILLAVYLIWIGFRDFIRKQKSTRS